MIKHKQAVTKKEQKQIIEILSKIEDNYNDFYITSDNKRIFIKEGKNYKKLFSCLKQGDQIIFGKEGILLILGYSDDSPRKYVKVLAKNRKDLEKLLQVLFWSKIKTDLYIKLKKDNKFINTFKKNKWKFYRPRGEEILLVRRHYD